MGLSGDKMSEEASEEKPRVTTEFVAGQQSVVLSMLTHMQADMRANHRENSSKIDTVLASIPIIQSDIGRHHHRITGLEQYNETEVKPVVDAHKRRKWVWAGWIGGLGAVSSPVWIGKIAVVVHAIFP